MIEVPLYCRWDPTEGTYPGKSRFENNYFTEICSGSEAGSYLRLMDFVHHSTLGLRVTKQKEKKTYPGVQSALSKAVTGIPHS